VILGVTHDSYANAKSGGDGAFGNGLRSVVGTFGVNVGTHLFQQHFDAGFGKEHDIVHAAERRHELRARIFIENWPARPLQFAHAGIGVQANDQDIAFAPRAIEIADVPDVQRIETAVGENDPPALALVLR